jgi:hypothetical protein
MKPSLVRVALCVLSAASCVSACAPTTPAFDSAFGSSVRSAVAEQALNPNASVANANKLPEGLDGRAARETMERYQRSFEQAPRQVNPFVIGVGGAGETTR